MLYKTIGEICDIIGGNAAPKGDDAFTESGTPFLKMRDLGRYHLTNNLIDIENKVNDEVAKRNKLKLVKKGTILLPRSGSVALNHRAILGVDSYMVSHIFGLSIKDSNKVYNEYLYYYLCTINFDSITKKTTGLDAVNFSDISKFKIPLPSLTEQKHIAEVLSKAEALIAERKQSIQLLDEYLKSTFLEMFGDPVKNEKGWEKVFLKDYCTKIGSGSTPRGGKESYFEEGISLIRSLNVHNDQFLMKDLAHIDDKQAYDLRNVIIEIDDVLLNITGASVARCCIVPKAILPARVNQHVSILRTIKENLAPMFLNKLITNDSFQKFLIKTSRSKGATREAITKEELETLKIILPPLKLQTQFAAIVEKTEVLKAQYKEHLQSLEQMYGALSQRAFRGELSKIEIKRKEKV